MSKTIDLDALTSEDALPRVRLFGRELLVRPLTGAAAHKLAVVQDNDPSGVGMLGALLDVVRVCVPGLKADEVDRLSVEQLGALVSLTRGAVADVEAMLAAQMEKEGQKAGPAAGPEGTTSGAESGVESGAGN